MHFLVADTLLSVIAAKKGCLVHIALAWVGSKKDTTTLNHMFSLFLHFFKRLFLEDTKD
jgi:hypothetical protein